MRAAMEFAGRRPRGPGIGSGEAAGGRGKPAVAGDAGVWMVRRMARDMITACRAHEMRRLEAILQAIPMPYSLKPELHSLEPNACYYL